MTFNQFSFSAIIVLILLSGCARPLFVTHLSSKGASLTKKKGQFMPSHKPINRFICFDKKCLDKAAWAKKQRKQQFKNKEDNYLAPKIYPHETPPKKDTTTFIAQREEEIYQPEQKTPAYVVEAPPKADSVITLNEVFFEVNSYKLKKPLLSKLDSLASFLRKSMRYEITVSGHTDNTGSESHNLKLSENRAEAVARYLADQGIDIARIIFNGFGSSRPIDTNDTKEGRGRNRRVEVAIHERR